MCSKSTNFNGDEVAPVDIWSPFWSTYELFSIHDQQISCFIQLCCSAAGAASGMSRVSIAYNRVVLVGIFLFQRRKFWEVPLLSLITGAFGGCGWRLIDGKVKYGVATWHFGTYNMHCLICCARECVVIGSIMVIAEWFVCIQHRSKHKVSLGLRKKRCDTKFVAGWRLAGFWRSRWDAETRKRLVDWTVEEMGRRRLIRS